MCVECFFVGEVGGLFLFVDYCDLLVLVLVVCV